MMWKMVFPVLAAFFAVGLGGLVGGPIDVDANDKGAQEALNFAVAQHNRESNDMYLNQVAEVVRVQKQVVSGLKYTITVKMARTNCRKEHAEEVCAIHENPELARPYECVFTVWSQPWLKTISLMNHTC